MITRTQFVIPALLVAGLAAPMALGAGDGSPVRGGQRNPGFNPARAFTSETQIIASTSRYGTRQSNKSDNGGGAIYGCRSRAGGTPAGNEPCIRANNLADGLAFEFNGGGLLGGTITLPGGERARPFTTTATGVATGLNADRVDSRHADELVADAVRAAVSAAEAQRPFAQVAADGKPGATRGVVATNGVSRSATGVYAVVFNGDRSACAASATLTGATPGQVTVDPALAADKATTTVTVRTFESTAPPTPADRGFHLALSC